MESEIPYMLGIVGIGFAVNYTLRALPFLLFAGRDRALPAWVARFGNILSPVIIAALIVYAFSGSLWRTPWPYLAGVLTVGLQLARRNALVSIVAGTALYMTLVGTCGCTSVPALDVSRDDTEIRVSDLGITVAGKFVTVEELIERLEDDGIPRTRTIFLRIDPATTDKQAMRNVVGRLSVAGYRHAVLVTERHAGSDSKAMHERKW